MAMRTHIAMLLFLALLWPVDWSAAGKKPGDILTREEATALLAPVFKNRKFTVLRVTRSPVEGLWEVIGETEAGKAILYVDRSKKFFTGGPIMALQGMRNLTEESFVSFNAPRVDPAQVPLEDALVLGNPNGGKRVVVFLSPTCRPCRDMLQTVKEVSDQRKDITFYLKMKPEGPVGDSFWRSETIVLTKSLALLEDSLEGLQIPKPARPVPQVAQTLNLAEKLGIHATPTVMLADGTLVEGVLPRKAFLGWIDSHSGGSK
ncbi:MAG: thioredoxin fold domain-containing protein [Deltaproteobacteria bacterium]|nr:thioredoxin fold domain-containing protein [Deltaproteobacteria bacterium]